MSFLRHRMPWLACLVCALLLLPGCGAQEQRASSAAPASSPPAEEVRHASDSEQWIAFETHVVDLLFDGEFASLDSIAATFTATSPRFRDGSSRERRFYRALSGETYRLSKGQRARWVGHLKNWRAARPDSRAATAGYACAMVKLAWDERGSGPGRTVDAKEYGAFERDLRLAWQALEPTADQRGNVGGWYIAAFRVALGLGWERGRVMQLRNGCLRDAPWIETTDGMAVRHLLPRWYGAPGEAEEFAQAVAKSSPDGRGPQRYAWIVISLQEVNANVFQQTDASWDSANAGFEALEQEHPDSITLPSFHARFAWLAGDREVARAQFAKLGDRMDEYVWQSDAEFLKVRRWAGATPS